MDKNLYKSVEEAQHLSVWPQSQIPIECLQQALNCGLVEEAEPSNCGASQLFLVREESKRRYRLVADTLETNSNQDISPSVKFTPIGRLHDVMRSCSFACEMDMRCFFHQFELSKDVRKFFSFKFGDKTFHYCRLPMGYKLAVDISQQFLVNMVETSKLLSLSGIRLVDVYVDNILIAGDEQPVRLASQSLLQLLETFNVTVGSVEMDSTITHRGITWNLTNKVATLSQKFMSKLVLPDGTRRSLWEKLISRVYYACLSLHYPRAFLWQTMQWYNKGTRGITKEVSGELDDVLTRLRQHSLKLELSQEIHFIATDASDTGYGYVELKTNNTPVGGQWDTTDKNLPIAYRELLAAQRGIKIYSNAHVVLFIDNTTIYFSIKNGYSHSRQLNDILRGFFTIIQHNNLTCQPQWIPSEQNPADAPSRLVHAASPIFCGRDGEEP